MGPFLQRDGAGNPGMCTGSSPRVLIFLRLCPRHSVASRNSNLRPVSNLSPSLRWRSQLTPAPYKTDQRYLPFAGDGAGSLSVLSLPCNLYHIDAPRSGPAVILPCLSKGALAVRFCPRLFRSPPPQQQQTGPLANAAGVLASRLPYRLIMAVASVDSVILYDMQVRLGRLVCAADGSPGNLLGADRLTSMDKFRE